MHGPTITPQSLSHRAAADRIVAGAAILFGAFLACGAAAAAPPRQSADLSLLSALKGAQLPDHRLARTRGGEFLIQSATSAGRVTGSANGATTGHIVDNNSINATGITNVFQNTGNNTLIQNTMTININVR